MVKLGPFVLHTLIGRGGASEVWQGSEEATGRLVAVKIAHAPLTDDRPCSFLEEARRMVRLRHPGLIQLYDYGRLPTEVEAATSGLLPAGSPYLVMELAATGLHHYSGQLTWPVLARILRAILEALSYIHAHELLHCDLKPGNLLMARDLKHVKLSDFGIACHREELAQRYKRKKLLGTPSYMSPEQFNRSWRDYGPWTDLYALGCAAVELLTGEPPFGHRQSLEEIKYAHLFEPFLGCSPPPDAPPAFSTWLAQMLAKDPADRFQCAADARYALEAMVEDLNESSEEPIIEEPIRAKEQGFGVLPTLIETQPIHTFSTTSIPPSEDRQGHEEERDHRLRTVPELQALRIPATPVPRPRLVPPLPERWPTQEQPEVPTQTYLTYPSLRDAEKIPLRDRQAQQQALWSLLHEVNRSGQSGFAWLEGNSGVGKSSLLRWLWRSVHQTGAALCLMVRPVGTPAQSMADMIMSYLRCDGLEGHALRYQISARMSTRQPQPEHENMRNTRVTLTQPWIRLSEWLEPYAALELPSDTPPPPTDPRLHTKTDKLPAMSLEEAITLSQGRDGTNNPDAPDSDSGLLALPSTPSQDTNPALTPDKDLDTAYWSACDDFLIALCHQRPVLLCIDDLQHYRPDFLDWCARWCEPPRPHPLLIVSAYNPEQADPPRHSLLTSHADQGHRLQLQLAPLPSSSPPAKTNVPKTAPSPLRPASSNDA